MAGTAGLERARGTQARRAGGRPEPRRAASRARPSRLRSRFLPGPDPSRRQGRLAGEGTALPPRSRGLRFFAPRPLPHPIPDPACRPPGPARPAGPEPRGRVADIRGGARSPPGLGRRPPLTDPTPQADQAEDPEVATREDTRSHGEPAGLCARWGRAARPAPAAPPAAPPVLCAAAVASSSSPPGASCPPGTRRPGPAGGPCPLCRAPPSKVACVFQRFVFAPPARPALLLGAWAVMGAAPWLGLRLPQSRAPLGWPLNRQEFRGRTGRPRRTFFLPSFLAAAVSYHLLTRVLARTRQPL